MFCVCSSNCKSFALLDSCQQHALDGVFVAILWQIQLVDARVALGKPVLVRRVDHGDRELLDSILAAQAFKALDRHLARAGHELDELGTLAVVELVKGFPEKLNGFRLGIVTLVLRVLAQVINVNDLKA